MPTLSQWNIKSGRNRLSSNQREVSVVWNGLQKFVTHPLLPSGVCSSTLLKVEWWSSGTNLIKQVWEWPTDAGFKLELSDADLHTAGTLNLRCQEVPCAKC